MILNFFDSVSNIFIGFCRKKIAGIHKIYLKSKKKLNFIQNFQKNREFIQNFHINRGFIDLPRFSSKKTEISVIYREFPVLIWPKIKKLNVREKWILPKEKKQFIGDLTLPPNTGFSGIINRVESILGWIKG